MLSIHRIARAVTPVTLAAVALASSTSVRAQQGTTVTGTVVDSVTLKPIAHAVVVLEELRREVRADGDARFVIDAVPAGTYHVSVRAPGYSVRRTELVVEAQPVTVDLSIDPQLHYEEVVSVGPTARSVFESYQPTSVLAGQDLAKALSGSLGDTLDGQPGVTNRSLGPSPSRPVIRGLDGDRVAILEDGQRMGDLSSQSADHGVTVNPAAAHKIEVVRGPATLLYGANAIGGLVNVINEQVPTARHNGYKAGSSPTSAPGRVRVAAPPTCSGAMAAGRFMPAARRMATATCARPTATSTTRRAAPPRPTWVCPGRPTRYYIGGSYGYDDMRYGVPVVEGGVIELTPQRHEFTLRSGGKDFSGFLNSYRATLGVRRYQHDELEGTEVGTHFSNNTLDFDLLAGHRTYGRLSGAVGFAAGNRDFEAVGAEALSPPVNQKNIAAFFYEELTWPHVTFQFGGRLDNARYKPEGGLPDRDFTNVSGSVGFLFRPAAANDTITIAGSLARAARNPALEELYFFGVHPGNFAFEIGDPTLESEVGLGVDLSLRWQTRRVSGEVTWFRNAIDHFIFRDPLTAEQIEAEFGPDFDAEDFQVIRFTPADSVLTGMEAHTDIHVTGNVIAEVGADYVRATNTDLDAPLPRIPPFRVRGGLRYQRNAFQAGGEVTAAAKQDRVFGAETPTDGYTTFKLFGAYSWQARQAVHTVTARLENVANERYFNHLSYIKDFVPEMGRSLKLVYSLRF